MIGLIRRYARWLHTGWPAGTVERLPDVREDGSTNVPGILVAGDLTGVPLLKFAADTGARAVETILAEPGFAGRPRDEAIVDVLIIGAGVAGIAAAARARRADLRIEIVEASEPLSTIVNFPRGKPIFTYPTDMTPRGDLRFDERSDVREGLIDMLREFIAEHGITPRHGRVERLSRRRDVIDATLVDGTVIRAHRVIVAIGRSGDHRRLGVPGESLDKVSNRLHDPADFGAARVLVVGGGDSVLETATAVAAQGGTVTLSYRRDAFSRPKPANLERLDALRSEAPTPGRVHVRLSTEVERIDPESIVLRNSDGSSETIPNDAVFTMIGREAPLDFFRRSGLRIRGEWRARTWISLILFLAVCTWLYHWKKGEVGLPIHDAFATRGWFPFNIGDPADPSTFLGTMTLASKSPGFWYSLVYCLCVVGFGVRRIRRRRTPYVTVQTVTLSLLQVIPLFLLPYLVLPWLGHNGWFDGGIGRTVADALFPVTEWDPQGREYWRTFGFVLAWPLFIWNVFTAQPMWTWLIISIVQTFVIIPLMIRRWGKGAYCGWICSCGALAETMGDAHRHKMPHGPGWNRANMIGQVFLLWVLFLLLLRVALWIHPVRAVGTVYTVLLAGGGAPAWLGEAARYLNYVWFVDVVWAGILGVGLYFWFSGRVWCRFACPLAALMHIYTRFSRFRILADKKKCISCNACTTVCHQGIDVMNFANKGRPMEDPECVRCSACVQTCPTGVLEFGRIDRRTGAVLGVDRLGASPVRAVELTVHGRATR